MEKACLASLVQVLGMDDM